MKRYVLCLLVLLLITQGCSDGKKSIFIPASTGRPYEVMVVVNDSVLKSDAGKALKVTLNSDVPGLPQAESSFSVSYISPFHFNGVIKIVRNIIIVDVQAKYTRVRLKYARDVYSSPQAIMNIQAPNTLMLEKYINENASLIIDFFVNIEMNRQIDVLKQSHNMNISNKVQKMFGCNVWLPVELNFFKEGKDFFWASTNSAMTDMNFVVYSYPYTDKGAFTRSYYLHKRDSVMGKNIPGMRQGMYMATDTLSVRTKKLNIENKYVMEARGLWYIKDDFMGGPFVSHIFLDSANQRVVTMEAFIYSPEKKKRNLVRQMEASLYTIQSRKGSVK